MLEERNRQNEISFRLLLRAPLTALDTFRSDVRRPPALAEDSRGRICSLGQRRNWIGDGRSGVRQGYKRGGRDGWHRLIRFQQGRAGYQGRRAYCGSVIGLGRDGAREGKNVTGIAFREGEAEVGAADINLIAIHNILACGIRGGGGEG